MVASVLLRWKYMWIALAVLTLLFLIACGYAACSARRSQERIVCRSGERHIVRRSHSFDHIHTVSRIVDNNFIVEPPSYQTFWVTDLPPAYSTLVSSQPPTSLQNYHLTLVDELSISPRFSNPPPYSAAIQSDNLTSQNGQPENRTLESNLQNVQAITQPGGQPWTLEPGHHTVRRKSYSEIPQSNEDKERRERRRSQSTGYLSNVITSTFVRSGTTNVHHQHDDQTLPTNEQRIVTNHINSGNNSTSESKI